MDGARFANALCFLKASPAEISWRGRSRHPFVRCNQKWRAGGRSCRDLDKKLAADFAFRRKRGGHLWSKMRFLAPSFDAYLKDELWLKNAANANAMATRLAEGLIRVPAPN